MRIGVNLYPLALRGGGMRQYALQLLPWLVRLSRHRFVLFHAAHGQPSLAAILRQLSAAERARVRSVQIVHQDEIFGHADRFDIYFCPLNCLAPDLLDRPTVATLADVQEQFFPHYFTPEQLALRGLLYPRTARAATILITISEFSKRSICQAFGVPSDKVRVTHLAANEEMRRARPEWPAALPALPERFVLYPANLYPHKSHELLLRAVRLLKDEYGVDCACVMTGHETSPGTPIREQIEACGLTGKALWLGHVSPGALRHLYGQAAALCFPSQFEGFGLPLLEAMANGCPVIATAAASIPEVVGDAALLVEPTAPALAEAVARVLTDSGLREQLVARGRQRARRFDPRRLARQTLSILKQAARRFAPPAADRRPRERVTFVVQPSRGGPALGTTLASLSFETHDHDQVLVLAEPGLLDAPSLSLLVNLPGGRLVPGGPAGTAWLDEPNLGVVCYLREGDSLCEGATRAALAALAEAPECVAAIGEAIATDAAGRRVGSLFVPPRSGVPQAGCAVPPAVVFWRRAPLLEHRKLLETPHWTNALLGAIAGSGRILERTFVLVDLEATSVQASQPRPQRLPWAARAAVRFLPRRLQKVLRRLYPRKTRPLGREE